MGKIEIQLGDIKKFKTARGEVAGIVIYKDKWYIRVLDLGSVVRDLNISDITEVTAVRLNPELRERLNKISEVVKEKERIAKEEQKLKEQKIKVEEKMGRQVDIMRKKLGVYSTDAFESEIEKAIENKLGNTGYTVFTNTSSNTVNINITKDKEIAKYPRESDYSFLFREYDGVMFVNSSGKDYDAMVKKCSQSGRELGTVKKLPKGFTVKEDRGLSMGDKYLVYTHGIYIEVKYDKFDKQLLSAILKILA